MEIQLKTYMTEEDQQESRLRDRLWESQQDYDYLPDWAGDRNLYTEMIPRPRIFIANKLLDRLAEMGFTDDEGNPLNVLELVATDVEEFLAEYYYRPRNDAIQQWATDDNQTVSYRIEDYGRVVLVTLVEDENGKED